MDNRRLPYLPQSNAGSIHPSITFGHPWFFKSCLVLLGQTRLIHRCESLTMKNITLIASKRITYIISVHIGFVINYSPNTRFDNVQCFIVKTTTDWKFFGNDGMAWLAIRYTTNYTEFLLPPSKGSHPTNSSTGILVLSEIGFIFADFLSHTSTPSHRTSRTLRMLYSTDTHRQNIQMDAMSPNQWTRIFWCIWCISHPMNREVSVTKSIKKHCKIT